MEVLSLSSTTVINISKTLPIPRKNTRLPQISTINIKSPNSLNYFNHFKLFSSSPISVSTQASSTSTYSPSSASITTTDTDNRFWMVLMKNPPPGLNSRQEIIDYYVETIDRVLGSEKDAQMCIYHASLDTHFGFCCDMECETAKELAYLPGVQSVRPDPDFNLKNKDYSADTQSQLSYLSTVQYGSLLFPSGNTKHWLVLVNKPGIGVVTKAQMVDHYAQLLTKVLGNEKDAQMCISHVSWKSNFGFCCDLDEECARELADVPGVLSVQLDNNFESENKDYRGHNVQNSTDHQGSSEASPSTPVKTKKLFVTGLSFYTSGKTLRAAFEGFGELVEVKIIMDKISKRSKGYAFIEYTTEEAAGEALKEMDGKIINGWMIVVDVAKSIPPRQSRGRLR